jgi:NitT/TauT family transport system permease protein
VGSDKGIGQQVLQANATLQTVTVFAGIGYITLVGIALFLITDLLERLLLPWHVSRRSVVVGTA